MENEKRKMKKQPQFRHGFRRAETYSQGFTLSRPNPFYRHYPFFSLPYPGMLCKSMPDKAGHYCQSLVEMAVVVDD